MSSGQFNDKPKNDSDSNVETFDENIHIDTKIDNSMNVSIGDINMETDCINEINNNDNTNYDKDCDKNCDKDCDKDCNRDCDDNCDDNDNDDDDDNEDSDNENDHNDKMNNNHDVSMDLFNPMNSILQQFIKNSFSKTNDNVNNGMLPVSFDLVIENYDQDGKKVTKTISSSGGKITCDITNDAINETISNESDSDKFVSTESKFDKMNDSLKKIKNTQNNNTKSLKRVDYASAIGDVYFLNKWSESVIRPDSYTTESLDNASANGHIEVLNWWKNANEKFGVELKYTEKAMNLASKHGKIESLNWWFDSGLKLKYDHNGIDWASSECRIDVLDWWFVKSMKSNEDKSINFEYTSNSIDNAKLPESSLLELVKWWNSVKNLNPNIKFKYTKDFINYLEAWRYKKTFDYLIHNKMIDENEKINMVGYNYSEKFPEVTNVYKKYDDKDTFKMFEFLGIPIGIGGSQSMGKKQQKTSSKYDLDSLPEDIQKHIKEKEEELNNNIMINGKAKEYIDNLIKIPFGKYKYEKIFCFLDDLINKINSINLSSSNDNMKKCKLLNESDLNKFFDSIKYFPENTYDVYQKLYKEFINIRKNYMMYVDQILNNCVYGHEATKKHIKCIISQWLSGGFKLGVVIGIQGPPGVGKTTMIKGALSKCLIDYIDYDLDKNEPYIIQLNEESIKNSTSRPFCFTSLGGTTNGSTLSGHNIAYHGATSGDIVKHLKEAKIMNPIIYFDELDKISNTEHGHEISSVLTHITDPAQNSHFTDRYFSEVKIDLSKAIIVFSYNDTNKIDRILLDRIQEIKLKPIKPKEKLVICKKFIIPEVCLQLGYNETDVNISDDELNTVINEYTMEAGVRKLKEKIFEIFRMRHLEYISNPDSKLSNSIDSKFILDTFSDYAKINYNKIKSHDSIGCINGLYASVSGLGGIVPIQVKQTYNKELLGINITGSIEKVMEESVKVAKTVAWDLLTEVEQNNVINKWESRGLHVHFPDGATPKDGPSAGTAITCAIYSLLTSKSIKNIVGITGEIDLDGNVTEIGGLDAKLNGAKKAGVKVALIPKSNSREFDVVKKNNPDLIDKNFKVIKISHVKDAFKYIF